MIKKALAVSGVAAAAAATSLAFSPAPAQASTTQCEGGSSSGRCVEVLSTSVNTTVVDSLPLSNSSSQTGTFNCGFTSTVTRSMEESASASVSVSAQIAGIGGEAGVTVAQSLSQSGSQATSAGGSFELAPGQSITCQRTYNEVTAQMREYTYSGTSTTETARYSVKVPSSFGVNVTD